MASRGDTVKKRPRPEWKHDSEDEDGTSNPVAVTLSPHTHRLLRLIQEGTADHARLAASRLTSIASQSSPLVLWDLLGRLVETLASPSWSCRYNASLAMEGIARHIPTLDQEEFLRSHHHQEQHNLEATTGMWLQISDLDSPIDESDNKSMIGLDVVIEKGRLLLASSGTQYDSKDDVAIYQKEEDQLQSLDASAVGGNRQDFLKHRVQLQRRILAQRLGFGGVLESVTDQAKLLSDDISNEDLLQTGSSTTTKVPSSSRRQQHMERIKKQRGQKNQGADDSSTSVRALLVMEMDQQRKSSSSGAATSHSKPQTLLATELIYRMFSPSWHIRHGALLGALSLLRSWKVSSSQNKDRHHVFGVWPHDILARCICVLALDRFGDYSGSFETVDESMVDSTGTSGGGVVAPVREMAGQVLSLLLAMAPKSLQESCFELLLRMADHPKEWEVRHGALLSLKYVAVVSSVNVARDQSDLPACLRRLSQVAVDRLVDDSDDVQCVAAQVLLCLIPKETTQQSLPSKASFEVNELIGDCAGPLWNALSTVRSVSSSVVDLVHLFSRIICQNCNLVFDSLGATTLAVDDADVPARNLEMLNKLLGEVVEFLGFDSVTVRLSTLFSVEAMSEPISMLLPSFASNNELVDGYTKTCFCLLKKLFDSYFEYTSASTDDLETKQLERLGRARDVAWKNSVECFRSLFQNNRSQTMELLLSMVVRYVGIRMPNERSLSGWLGETRTNGLEYSSADIQRVAPIMSTAASCDPFLTQIHSSRALSHLFSVVVECTHKETAVDVIGLFEITVISLLQSPWFSLCESACLLYKSTSLKMAGRDTGEDRQNQVLELCRNTLHNSLLGLPFCVEVEGLDETTVLRSNEDIVAICDRAFVSSLVAWLVKRERGCDDRTSAALELVKQWKGAFAARVGSLNSTRRSFPVTLGSVRVSAVISGSLLPSGRENLPCKLTPMIRALVTSLKSETDGSRRRETCLDLVRLLNLLSSSGTPQLETDLRVRDKVLGNICALSVERMSSASPDIERPSSGAATHVLERMVVELPADATLESLPPVWDRLKVLVNLDISISTEASLEQSLCMMGIVSTALRPNTVTCSHLVEAVVPSLVLIACECPFSHARVLAILAMELLCKVDATRTLKKGLRSVFVYLRDVDNDSFRFAGCSLLHAVVAAAEMDVCAFVRCLLPTVMSLMTDPLEDCAKLASKSFATLVRVAPLVRKDTSISLDGNDVDDRAEKVIDHLIHGMPLPSCDLPAVISSELQESNTVLRPYQTEGVAWLRFLHTVNLNGALCDDMGLGKTLQALISIALSHCRGDIDGERAVSLVVCPSTVVGHWVAEIQKFFPTHRVFRAMSFVGNAKQRKSKYSRRISGCNIVVTSYSYLRSDIELLAGMSWRYCVLDEGHLLKNPKTATAVASRRIRARHRLILTGTPVQNRVNELWAAFDFLMPNFLGSASAFAKEFAKPISAGHLPDASAESITDSIEKLKALHQQVLPFILRREKGQVLEELPPKCITNVPCVLSSDQEQLYKLFCDGPQGRKSLAGLQKVASGSAQDLHSENEARSVGSEVLQSLLYLRLLCTHPTLVKGRSKSADDEDGALSDNLMDNSYASLECSGKLLALSELLRFAGIGGDELTAADNDTSLLYCGSEDDGNESFPEVATGGDLAQLEDSNISGEERVGSKCLIFAQFSQSLDVVEKYLFLPHMPSLRYLRMDGQTPLEKRANVVERFNTDHSIKVMLLTTRVGGLGLNLTGADTVIFLEHDWNPHVDLQAMDRCHRIGQTRKVNVYRLVTSNTIEEQVMKIQEAKLAVSNAIVNTDNSTMYSMGTDRLLDIFTFRRDNQNQRDPKASQGEANGESLGVIDDMYSMEDYASLSVHEFIRGLQQQS